MGNHHEKKIAKRFYDKIRQRLKMFEIRKDDHKSPLKYKEGDTISFTDLEGNKLPGKWLISYILRYEDFPEGITPGYVVMNLIEISR